MIIGAKKMEQLTENLGACDVEIGDDDLKKLDKVSRLPREYPGWMLARQSEYRDPYKS